MASRIKITTNELKSQSQKLEAYSQEMQDLYTRTKKAVNIIDSSMSAKFASNMMLKASGMLQQMLNVKNQLRIAGLIAERCATDYENADTVIRKNIIGLSEKTLLAPVSSQQVVLDYQQQMEEVLAISIGDDGKRGGAAYGRANQNWCDAYVAHLLSLAGINMTPYLSGQVKQLEPYTYAEKNYIPKTGDLIFFDWNNDGKIDHVGMTYINEKNEVCVLHGNYHTSRVPNGEVSYDKIFDIKKYNKNVALYFGDMTAYMNS